MCTQCSTITSKTILKTFHHLFSLVTDLQAENTLLHSEIEQVNTRISTLESNPNNSSIFDPDLISQLL